MEKILIRRRWSGRVRHTTKLRTSKQRINIQLQMEELHEAQMKNDRWFKQLCTDHIAYLTGDLTKDEVRENAVAVSRRMDND